MILERLKSEGIAHNSYLVGSESEAAVIDPRRDCQIYVELAQQHGLHSTPLSFANILLITFYHDK